MPAKEKDSKPTLALLDSAINVNAIKLLVEKKFDIVIASHNRTEVIKKINEVKPNGLLMDFRIDDNVEVGCKVIEEVKSVSPQTRVIVLTGAEEIPLYLIKAFQSGADGYISRKTTGIGLDVIISSVVMGLTVITPRNILQKVIDTSSRVVEYDERYVQEPNSKLTIEEIKILELVAKGLTNRDIANKLFKAYPTIKGQLQGIFHKLGCNTREDAVRLGIMSGQISGDLSQD